VASDYRLLHIASGCGCGNGQWALELAPSGDKGGGTRSIRFGRGAIALLGLLGISIGALRMI